MRRIQFTQTKEEYESSSDCSSGDETLSGESCTFRSGQDDLSGETMSKRPWDRFLSEVSTSKRPRDRMLSEESTSEHSRDTILSGESTLEQSRHKVLSGESRNIMDKSEDDEAVSISSSADSQSQPWENVSETTSKSNVSEIAIYSLLVEWKERVIDREMHQGPDRDRYTSEEEGTEVDNAADELELIAVSKHPTRLLPHATVIRTNLEPSLQEATPLKKILCVN